MTEPIKRRKRFIPNPRVEYESRLYHEPHQRKEIMWDQMMVTWLTAREWLALWKRGFGVGKCRPRPWIAMDANLTYVVSNPKIRKLP
ncbi:hypothetical protein A0U90_06395 [Kozakia baliensis]|nr:hypothetical protein A0U90_06395 [Kozakia baliensis]